MPVGEREPGGQADDEAYDDADKGAKGRVVHGRHGADELEKALVSKPATDISTLRVQTRNVLKDLTYIPVPAFF